ncbi:ABC transporter ATP-binding protein [Enterococcus gilvus]|uniref:ABC transporter ATP-binding protein n=1 Tax=Enterococcus gilvus TaxID=160453 RepID=UPI003EDAC787
MLILKNVTKKNGDKVILNDVSLKIDKGLNVFVGKSGSGKTTLLKIISGLITDYSGEVLLDNDNVVELIKKKDSKIFFNRIGIAWQDFHLMEQLTVEENILLASQLADSSGVEQQKRIKELLGKLGLRGKEKRKVNKLSGGERQRVAFARALINNPEIIIADEPTSALDKNNKKGIMMLISQLAEERTVVLVTHDEIDIPVNANIYIG